MNKQITNNKYSLIIGIFLILAIGITIALIQQGVLTISQADETAEPMRVQITNVTDNSFTVSYTTSAKSTGALRLLLENDSNRVILDDRDKANSEQNNYFSHHITVTNLEPQKTYTFSIISDGKEYTSEAEYRTTTAPSIESDPPSQNPLSGKVILPDGTVGSDTLVIINSENSSPISSVTNENGGYTIPATTIRNDSLNSYINLRPETQIFLDFFRQNYIARITANYQIGQNLPTITLNQDYSFSAETDEIPDAPQQGFDSTEEISEPTSQATVNIPNDNQSFIDNQPTFSGTGGAGRIVNINISTLGINEAVNISEQNTWSFRFEEEIPAGQYVVNFDIQNSNGISQRITRNFSILASGTQVTESATPSATPTFTPTPTEPEVTLTPTITPTPTTATTQAPTPTLDPETNETPTPTTTDIPTVTPDNTPTSNPTIAPTNTPMPPIQDPGNTSSTVILSAFSILLIVAGAAIFFAL